MNVVIGAVAGLLWGALIAWLNARITRAFLTKGTANAVMTGNLIRTLTDIGALTLVFLLRNVLPFSFEAAIVATAIALGLLTVLFAFRLAKAADGTGARQPEGGTPADSAAAGKPETKTEENGDS